MEFNADPSFSAVSIDFQRYYTPAIDDVTLESLAAFLHDAQGFFTSRGSTVF
jgi:hypothetical protein